MYDICLTVTAWCIIGLLGVLLIRSFGFREFHQEKIIPWLVGIAMIFFVGPVILMLGALFLAFSFKLNRQTHGVLKDEITRLEEGGDKAKVTPQTRLVVEELTGHPYETLWPQTPRI